METKKQETDGKQTEETPNKDNLLVELSSELNNLKFFSDNIRFNSIIYQGMNMILEKIVKMEEEVQNIKKLMEKSDEKKA